MPVNYSSVKNAVDDSSVYITSHRDYVIRKDSQLPVISDFNFFCMWWSNCVMEILVLICLWFVFFSSFPIRFFIFFISHRIWTAEEKRQQDLLACDGYSQVHGKNGQLCVGSTAFDVFWFMDVRLILRLGKWKTDWRRDELGELSNVIKIKQGRLTADELCTAKRVKNLLFTNVDLKLRILKLHWILFFVFTSVCLQILSLDGFNG